MTKVERIKQELKKQQEKEINTLRRIKELEQQLSAAETSEIHGILKSLSCTPDRLKTLLIALKEGETEKIISFMDTSLQSEKRGEQHEKE